MGCGGGRPLPRCWRAEHTITPRLRLWMVALLAGLLALLLCVDGRKQGLHSEDTAGALGGWGGCGHFAEGRQGEDGGEIVDVPAGAGANRSTTPYERDYLAPVTSQRQPEDLQRLQPLSIDSRRTSLRVLWLAYRPPACGCSTGLLLGEDEDEEREDGGEDSGEGA